MTLRQSSIRSWLKCRAEYFGQYVLGLDLYYADPALDFGTHFHTQVENYHLGKPYDQGLIAPYVAQYEQADFEAIEEPFSFVPVNPSTGEALRASITGRVDRRTKTAMHDVKTSRTSYSQAKVDAVTGSQGLWYDGTGLQPTIYLWQHWQTHGELLPFIFDVYRKDKPQWEPERRLQVITTQRTVDDFERCWLMLNKVIAEIEAETVYPCSCRDEAHKMWSLA